MEPIFDALTISAIISAVCVMLLVLVLSNCCKMRKVLHQFFSQD